MQRFEMEFPTINFVAISLRLKKAVAFREQQWCSVLVILRFVVQWEDTCLWHKWRWFDSTRNGLCHRTQSPLLFFVLCHRYLHEAKSSAAAVFFHWSSIHSQQQKVPVPLENDFNFQEFSIFMLEERYCSEAIFGSFRIEFRLTDQVNSQWSTVNNKSKIFLGCQSWIRTTFGDCGPWQVFSDRDVLSFFDSELWIHKINSFLKVKENKKIPTSKAVPWAFNVFPGLSTSVVFLTEEVPETANLRWEKPGCNWWVGHELCPETSMN